MRQPRLSGSVDLVTTQLFEANMKLKTIIPQTIYYLSTDTKSRDMQTPTISQLVLIDR